MLPIDQMKNEIRKAIKMKSKLGVITLSCHGIELTVVSELLKWATSEGFIVSISVYDKPNEHNYVSLSIELPNAKSMRINLFSKDYMPDIQFYEDMIFHHQKELTNLTNKKNEILASIPEQKLAFDEIQEFSKNATN